MNRVRAARLAPEFNLPACDRAVAQDANALVVQRMPFSPKIGRLKDRQFFFWKERFIHLESERSKADCLRGWNQRVL